MELEVVELSSTERSRKGWEKIAASCSLACVALTALEVLTGESVLLNVSALRATVPRLLSVYMGAVSN